MNNEEKKPWIAIAAKDKQRYETEMIYFRESELNSFLKSLPKDGDLADEVTDEDTYDVLAEEERKRKQKEEKQYSTI